MLLWIPAIADANLLCPFLDMMINLIKFNAAHLDKDILVGIVQWVAFDFHLKLNRLIGFVYLCSFQKCLRLELHCGQR